MNAIVLSDYLSIKNDGIPDARLIPYELLEEPIAEYVLASVGTPSLAMATLEERLNCAVLSKRC